MRPSLNWLCGIAVLLTFCPAIGQDKAGSAATIAPEIVTIEQLKQELTRLKESKLLPLAQEQQRVVVLLTDPRLDLVYSGQEPRRVLLVRATLANLTDTAIEVPPESYVLKVGNAEMKPDKMPGPGVSRIFNDGTQNPNNESLTSVTLKLAPLLDGVGIALATTKGLLLLLRGTRLGRNGRFGFCGVLCVTTCSSAMLVGNGG